MKRKNIVMKYGMKFIIFKLNFNELKNEQFKSKKPRNIKY